MRLKITTTAGETETMIKIEGELVSQGISDLPAPLGHRRWRQPAAESISREHLMVRIYSLT